MKQSPFKTVIASVIVALAYFVAGRLGLMVPAVGSNITLIWLPTGIAVAALFRWGFATWPGITLGAFAVNIAVGTSWPAAVGIAMGNTLSPVLIAWTLQRMHFHPAFDRKRDILLLAAAAILGTLVSASMGIASLSLAAPLPEGRLAAWLIWWAGETMGVIAGAPLLFASTRETDRAIQRRRTEFLICLGLTALAMWFVFIAYPAPGHPQARSFVVLPFLAWAALRFGAAGTSLAIIILSAGATYGAAMGRGPFYRENPVNEALMIWSFMATCAVLGWLITALQAARVQATGIQRLFEQALTDVSLGVLLAGLDRRITYLNHGFTRLTGYTEEDLLGKSCAILQGPDTDPATAERLKAAVHADGIFDGEILNYRKDRTTFWNALLLSPVRDEGGVMTGFLGIQRDISQRKDAELALHQSELRYRQLFDANPQPMWVHDFASLRFLAVNDAAIAHYGYSREEFLAMTTRDIRPPDEIPKLLATVEAVSEGLDHHGVWRHRKRDGSIIDVEVSAHALDLDGRKAAVVLANDITERRRSETRSEGERAVLELLSSGAPLASVLDRLARSYEEIFPGMLCSVLLLDADGKHLRHGAAPSIPEDFRRAVDGAEIGPNAGSCGTAAYTRQTTVVADIATDPRWQEYRNLALSNGLRACWSVPVISSQGRVLGTLALYYHEAATPRPDEVAAVERGAHFASLAIDRHQLLRSLRESQVRLETLVSNLPGMAYRSQHPPQWTLTYVSDGCEAITGYRREELENDRVISFGQLVHPDDRERIWAATQADIAARKSGHVEYRIIHKDGRERWISDRDTAVYGADGAVLFLDGFIQDITEARQAKIEREQLDRKVQETQKLESLGVLAGGIAHDFNNLLTSILGNASFAATEVPPGTSVAECLEQITEASLRAADLCKQMLAYSGRGRFLVQKLDLGQLVEETAQMLQISISKKAVLRFRLEKGLPPIEVDATQIRQVIMNLVINASEAIGDRSGVVSISTGLTHVDRAYLHSTLMDPDLPEGNYVFLEVSDSGCGMNAETLAKIFDPFFTTKFTGRGLGLAAVLGIARGHKGAVKVYSEPGRGTTFKLLFPSATGASDAPAGRPSAASEWRGTGTVLVVDDEETMRSTVARMMRKMGLDPVLVSDGREAVELFRANPAQFAMVLLDLTMPHMDGEQTFTALRRLRPDVRVVLMSGFNAQEATVRFHGKGLADFLQKPFTFDALRTVLQSVMG